MRHLGTIAMEMCRYQYRFGKPALVKVLVSCEGGGEWGF